MTIEMVKNAGHLLPEECPELVAERTLEFFARRRRKPPRRELGASNTRGRRRIVGGATVAGALILGATLSSGTDAESAAPRGMVAQPNVLVVMTDDQRLSDLAKAMPRTLTLRG